MTQERRTSPLPAGRYWLDVFDKPEGHMNELSAWSLSNAQKGTIQETEENDQSDPKKLFVIFNVLEPVFFPAKNFAFPEIAGSDVPNSDDQARAPDGHEPTSGDLVDGLVSFGKWTFAGAALLLIAKLFGGRR